MNPEIDPIALLGFLAVFHLIGGAAFGIGSRRWRTAWRSGQARTPPFLAMWGLIFGGLPLIFGPAAAEWGIFVAQIALFVGAAAASYFFYEPLKEMLGQRYVFMVIFGAIFMIAGIVAASLIMRGEQTEFWRALLFGGLFFAVGSLVFVAGIVQWTKKRQKPDKPLGAAEPTREGTEPPLESEKNV